LRTILDQKRLISWIIVFKIKTIETKENNDQAGEEK